MNAKSLSGYVLSFLVGGALSYFLFKGSKDTNSVGPLSEQIDSVAFINGLMPRGTFGLVDTATAHPNIRSHAANGAYANLSMYKKAKIKGVLHDTTEFRDYMNSTFAIFTKNHTPAEGYVWQIGVYPMIFKQRMEGADKPRLSFYFIPTMVKYQNGVIVEIIDYMEAIGNSELKKYYVHNLRRNDPTAKIDEEEYIFDEGQLWP